MALLIIDPKLNFASLLDKRLETKYLVLHHAGKEECSVQEIHRWHLARTWAGIGYNFYVRKNGTIYKGRDWEYAGAHTSICNSLSIGICFEGNYEKEQFMPVPQLQAGAYLIADALSRYPSIDTICRHSDARATECPGKYFPFKRMVEGGKAGGVLPPQKSEDYPEPTINGKDNSVRSVLKTIVLLLLAALAVTSKVKIP